MLTRTGQKPRLVLVGNGMAGMRTVEELLKLKPDMYEITVFGAEPHGNYNRILLSPVLAGEKTVDEILLNDDGWYAERGIRLHKGRRVAHIHRGRREVVAEDGTREPYDRLLLATGSTPFVIPVPGHDLPGVVSFRDLQDVDAMLAASRSHRRAVVIGGGLLGLEAANGLLRQGMEVTVVHLMDTLMERQLDPPAAALLQRSLEAKGLQFRLAAQTEAILGDGRVTGVRFRDGTEVPADLVVMAVGIRPNVELAKASGIHCERGVVVNDTLQTYDPVVYAVGECVQHRGQCYGLVAPLWEQAKVCANHLAEYGIARYEGSVTATRLKVTGIDLFSAGDFLGDEHSEDLVFQDAARGVYKKLVLRDGVVRGAVLYGDTIDGSWYFQLLREGTPVNDLRDGLLFGQAHLGDSGHGDDKTRVAALPDAAEICGCNGVCKGAIVQAITEKKLFTLDDVRAHTKASSSCGSCTGLVESLLATTLGGDYSQTPAKKPVCACTEHSHDEVRAAITAQGLKTMAAVFEALDWKTPDGCHVCRPALNYYLLAAWPGEYRDDAQSRFINERAHGNIQKDGTYSVVPRIWGGVTTPTELRAIAAVAEKYRVPTVKFTGGQRIDLLGVKKEDLPAMWRDLGAAGFVSGHAYGKALRTVKTCVGSEWCRFGTQDSTGLGIQMEKLTWGSWTPHKFKMGVSGCPRNCAEATIKDLGVVCVDSGYEIHVGGNGGVKVRVTDFLCKVATEAEVLEMTGAFMQLYREEARYLERTAPWIERVGLTHVQQAIVEDADNRARLHRRFLESQGPAQVDPWAKRAAGHAAQEFQPLTPIAERHEEVSA
ncbi:nitrite reductase large subunit NirB [Thioalkalivibrio paradoxus]|uniref:Nitrite reductase n=1 Tax=Thioalkalivibrio paradoxus ARh 1 TaxID=713585 RepID=W0DLB9_9GAMM|nr:nitrite reductase large subunit NirB [Thioalkalivibrio paradoxus]AHE97788.1 nitrite reductase [Thioalkalivibrio paradoxus ARh 1]